jgi:hypothetical protein
MEVGQDPNLGCSAKEKNITPLGTIAPVSLMMVDFGHLQ